MLYFSYALIEKIDSRLLEIVLSSSSYNDSLEMNTETPGSVFDRLSINALKIFYMKVQTRRTQVEEKHIKNCLDKLKILKEQRKDLSFSLKKLLEDLERGRKRLKVYRQMKMYNDKSLNPFLYKSESILNSKN